MSNLAHEEAEAQNTTSSSAARSKFQVPKWGIDHDAGPSAIPYGSSQGSGPINDLSSARDTATDRQPD